MRIAVGSAHVIVVVAAVVIVVVVVVVVADGAAAVFFSLSATTQNAWAKQWQAICKTENSTEPAERMVEKPEASLLVAEMKSSIEH